MSNFYLLDNFYKKISECLAIDSYYVQGFVNKKLLQNPYASQNHQSELIFLLPDLIYK